MVKARLTAFLVGVLVLTAAGCGGEAAATATTVPERATPASAATAVPSLAPTATESPTPSLTATATATPAPAPTATPVPTATPKATATPTPSMGKWVVGTYTDPLDDSILTGATLAADSGEGMNGDPVGLDIICLEGLTGLGISWGSYLGMDDPDVTYRIDDAPAETRQWTISSTDYEGTFFPYSSRKDPSTLAFIQKLMEADQLIARVDPYMGASITAIFDLTGIENALEEVRAACGW